MVEKMLTKLEADIINELMRDSDRPRKSIARKISSSSRADYNISDSQLSKSIAKLRDTGVIKNFSVNIDYTRLGFGINAISEISINDQRDVAKVSELLQKIEQAVEVYTALGETDFFVRWLCRDTEELSTAINMVTSSPDVKHVRTTSLMKEVKKIPGPLV